MTYQTPRWQWRLPAQLPFSGHTWHSGALWFSTVKHNTQGPLSSEHIPANSATLVSVGSSSFFPLPVIDPPQVTDQFHFKYIFWAHLLSQVLHKALSYQGAGKKYGWSWASESLWFGNTGIQQAVEIQRLLPEMEMSSWGILGMCNKKANLRLRFREGVFETGMMTVGWHRLGKKNIRGREYLLRTEVNPLIRPGAMY